MASKTNEIRYTDENYVTEQGLKKALGISLIDYIWKGIDNYRYANARRLNLRTITQIPFWYTSTQALYDKYAAFETKLSYFQTEYSKIALDPELKKEADKKVNLIIVKAIAEASSIALDDLSAKALVNGLYHPTDEKQTALLNYFNALKSLTRDLSISSGEDFIAKEYATILGTEDLLSFYRDSDPKNIFSTVIVGRVYESAPCEQINSLMDALWDFINVDSSKGFIKALTTLYYVNYVKPFDLYNPMVASLLGKYVLGQNNLAGIATILPLELLLIPTDRSKDENVEIQKKGDITYFLLYGIDKLTPIIDSLLDEFVSIKKAKIAQEFVAFPQEEIPMEAKPAVEPSPLEKKAATPVEASPESISNEPAKAQAAPSLPLSPSKTKPIEKVSVERIEQTSDNSLTGSLALSLPKSNLSEKEMKEVARYILETHPNIRKGQANFFASHCTIGRYYTIQDYKKANKVAYETARTSMDNLALEGFYKKLQIKNKYVYTPIKQGE